MESNAKTGKIIVTERGKPRFLLRPYRAKASRTSLGIDFYKRVAARRPRALSETQSRAIDKLNRG
jgi:hypothetical protein